MILFLKRIPKNTLPSELHDYVSPALKGGLFSPSGRILKAEILVMLDKRTDAYEFHGLVHIDSEVAGQRAIKKLHGKRLKNKPVFVREYFQRAWHNDRRQNRDLMTGNNIENRIQDRRRGNNLEVINDISTICRELERSFPQFMPITI